MLRFYLWNAIIGEDKEVTLFVLSDYIMMFEPNKYFMQQVTLNR